MKRVNIKCPYCKSQAFLRPATVVYGQDYHGPSEELYVCAKYPACAASASRPSPRSSVCGRAA